MKKQKRTNSKPYLAILIALALVVSMGQKSSAAPVTGFEPGRIMDDIIMTNHQSMTVAQIQAFLDSKVPVCDSDGSKGSTPTARKEYFAKNGWPMPIVCLRNYVENSKSSAQIIYDISREFRINPQVLIVLLQKEQGLVTDSWPDPTQYRTATGYGCPDTAVCETKYYGFTNQVRNAANMFRKILDASPAWYTPYIIGNNSIRYNPNYNCGSTTVNIQNRATQALYNYTPYQPNQAALNAGYGSGDSCSAYGNRNFYQYFKDWFGSTQRRLISSTGKGVYIVEDGKKRPFPSEEIFLSHSYKWSDVLTISSTEFNLIPEGEKMTYNASFRNTKRITTAGKGIYFIQNGKKRPFPNEEIFLSYSFKWANIITISSTEFNLIPEGETMTYNASFRNTKRITTAGKGIYIVEDGKKRPFPSEEIFLSHSYKWSDVLTISSTEFNLIPEGEKMTYNASFRNTKRITTAGKGIYFIQNGKKRPFPNEEIFLSYSFKWANIITISSTEFNLIPEGETMTMKAS